MNQNYVEMWQFPSTRKVDERDIAGNVAVTPLKGQHAKCHVPYAREEHPRIRKPGQSTLAVV
jgi:hypothetical protein